MEITIEEICTSGSYVEIETNKGVITLHRRKALSLAKELIENAQKAEKIKLVPTPAPLPVHAVNSPLDFKF